MNKIQKFIAEKVLRLPTDGEFALGGFSTFDALNPSTARTQLLLPPAETSKQITPFTRKQLLGKYHSLRNNIGLFRRLVGGCARYAVGPGISPKAMTSDEEWNKAHDLWFERVATNPLLFDFEGRMHYYRGQKQVAMAMMGEGEIFTNCVDPEKLEGAGNYIPQFQFLSANRVDNARTKTSSNGGLGMRGMTTGSIYGGYGPLLNNDTFDGLGINANNNRVMFYRVPRLDTDGYDDLDADHVIHTYDPDRVGMLRGITWLYHGINSAIDMLDLTALEKHAAKVHSALAATVKNKMASTGSAGLTGQLEALLTKQQLTTLQQSNPKERNKLLERIFGGGIVPFLGPDEELELLTSTRPSPTFTGFLDWLVRDVAWGFGVSPEFIWAVAGMGGASTRFLLQDAQWFFDEIAVLVIDNWAAPVRNKMVSAAILANQSNPSLGLPDCKDPDWRLKVHWQTPPRVTADPGKEAQSNIALLANGMSTWGDYWGGQGQSGRSKIQERIKEVGQAYLDIETARKELDPTGKVLTPETFNFPTIFPMGGKPGTAPSNDPNMPEYKKANED